MNVLFVCHRFPYPPKRGGKIRPFNIIRHLHDAGHAVTVASLELSSSARLPSLRKPSMSPWKKNTRDINQRSMCDRGSNSTARRAASIPTP